MNKKPVALASDDVDLLLDASPDALLLVDAGAVIQAANAQADEIFGVPPGALVGRPIHDLVPPTRRAQHQEQMRAYADNPHLRRMGQCLNCMGVRADGSVIPLDIYLRPCVTAGGPATLAAVRDLTDRHRMEEALRTSEERLRQSAVLAKLGSWELDLATDARTYSPELLDLLGLTAPHATSDAFMQDVHPEDRAALQSATSAAMAKGEPYRTRLRLRHADGSWRWLETSAAPSTGADGRAMLRGIVQDVTDRVTAELAAERARAHWEAIVRQSPDFIATLDRQGMILSVNRASRPGLQPADLEGHSVTEFLGEECREQVMAALTAVFDRREITSVDPVREYPDGTKAYFQTQLGPVVEGGQVVAAVASSREVTERRNLEAQIAMTDRLASVGMLAAGVAHEVNSPLAALLCNLDLAAAEVGSLGGNPAALAEHREKLVDAREAARTIRTVVSDLRTFSRAGTQPHEAVELAQALEPALRMAAHQVRQRARLVATLGPTPPVKANPSKLGQVVLNLLLNASQAIPAGCADAHEVRVTTRAQADDVVVEVTDTGAGMTPETLKRLFTPFFTTKPEGEGTGLGLVISQRIVNELGGRLTVESVVGKGSTFRLTLPAAPRRASADAGTVEAEVATAGMPRRARVLVVDDDPLFTRAVARILEPTHEVVAVHSGRSAVELLTGGAQFDVVLCDLAMPGCNGLAVYRAVSERAPAMAQRIVFVSGGVLGAEARDFLESVTNARVAKPFDVGALRAVVASFT
ncbi:MAG: PAS domain S-box protein [Deltaproteobacteria bacterium]|nr:PAS domain S-box protein [Deltaproteobacteria bacterium]